MGLRFALVLLGVPLLAAILLSLWLALGDWDALAGMMR